MRRARRDNRRSRQSSAHPSRAEVEIHRSPAARSPRSSLSRDSGRLRRRRRARPRAARHLDRHARRIDRSPPRSTPSLALEPRYVDWPFFGRVPQRTHYLPTSQGGIDRPLDPPLKQAWTVNTHGLIEFPPAIAGGVAYAINKYGNGKAIELGDPQDHRRTAARPEEQGPPAHRHRTGLLPRAWSTAPSSTARSPRATRRPASWPGSDTSTPTSNPRRCRSTATSTSAPTPPRSSPSTPATATPSGPSRRPARSKRAPATTPGTSSSATTRARCSR